MRDWRWREGSVPLCRLRVIIDVKGALGHYSGGGSTTNFEACSSFRGRFELHACRPLSIKEVPGMIVLKVRCRSRRVFLTYFPSVPLCIRRRAQQRPRELATREHTHRTSHGPHRTRPGKQEHVTRGSGRSTSLSCTQLSNRSSQLGSCDKHHARVGPPVRRTSCLRSLSESHAARTQHPPCGGTEPAARSSRARRVARPSTSQCSSTSLPPAPTPCP
jgi:hypothetical protein